MSAGMKRYNLVLPEDIFNELQQTADDRYTTVAELIRQFIKLGLFVVKSEGREGSAMFIREGATEQRILLV